MPVHAIQCLSMPPEENPGRIKRIDRVLKKLLLLVPSLKLIVVKGFKKHYTTSLELTPPPPPQQYCYTVVLYPILQFTVYNMYNCIVLCNDEPLTIIFRGKNMLIIRGKRFLLVAVLLCSPFCLSQGKKLLEILASIFAFEEGKRW
jgi:hypothetical protein